jgi:hypothetical protein
MGRSNFTYTTGLGAVAVGVMNNTITATYAPATGVITGTPAPNTGVGASSVALGIKNTSTGLTSLAVGYNSTASSENAISIGNTADAGAADAISIGSSSSASGISSVSIGEAADTTGDYTVALGYGTSASSLRGVSVGYNSDADANYAVAIGNTALASDEYTVAIGHTPRADIEGEISFANGSGSVGRSQKSVFIFTADTSDATPINMTLGGNNSQLVIPSGTVIGFSAIITARTASNDVNVFFIKGCIKNIAGTTSLVSDIVKEELEEDPALNCDIVANDTADTLEVVVTGKAATAIKWTAVLDCARTTY